jgi:cytochrome P450 family 628
MAPSVAPLEHAIYSALLGVIAHQLYFRRGEHTWLAPYYALILLLAPLTLYLIHRLGFKDEASQSLVYASTIYTSFLTGLFSSLAIYRLYFHPLRRYPGPPGARLSQLWFVWQMKEKVDSAWFLQRLHQQYGEYVRIGPNMLSISDPDMINSIHGPGAKFEKGEWYDQSPYPNLQQLRDKAVHDRRRRLRYDPAFTAKALRDYEPRVLRHATTLTQQFRVRAGQDVNATQWSAFYFWDIMGDLSFGTSFKSLETGKAHDYMANIHSAIRPFGIMSTNSWVGFLLQSLVPRRLVLAFQDYSRRTIEHRIKNPPEERDIVHHFLELEPEFADPETNTQTLTAETSLLIIAGSDTAASVLTFTMYYLATVPGLAKQLRQELEANNIRDDGSLSIPSLTHLVHLNALINEVLRLWPPVPSGLHRMPPRGGATVNGRYFPGGIQILTPTLAIQHCKSQSTATSPQCAHPTPLTQSFDSTTSLRRSRKISP